MWRGCQCAPEAGQTFIMDEDSCKRGCPGLISFKTDIHNLNLLPCFPLALDMHAYESPGSLEQRIEVVIVFTVFFFQYSNEIRLMIWNRS